VLLVLVVAGCSGSSSDELTVSGLHDKARAAGGSCPVSYDIAKAAHKAGASGAATPQSGADAVTADVRETSEKDSAAQKYGATQLECDYRIGADDITAYTVGVERGSALSLMLPRIQAAGQLSMSDLRSYYETAQKAKPGTASVTSSGNVATVRLRVSGKGDLILVVSATSAGSGSSTGHAAIKATELTSLAEDLAAQARW
jgi:hypothetical protein